MTANAELAAAAPWQSPGPVLLAEHAREATRPGVCSLCPRSYRRGDRVADVVGGRGVAHVGCAGQLAAGERR